MDEELLTTEQQTTEASPETESTEIQQEETTEGPSNSAVQDNDELRLLSTYARNAAQQNQYLQQQLHEMRQQLEYIKPNTPQSRQPVVTDDDFRESPAAAMEKLFESKLEEKLNRTISPLLEAQREQQRERIFNQTFESTLSAMNPALIPYASALAPEVRRFLGNADPTPQALQMATLMVVGNYALQGGAPGNNVPQNPQANNMAPANNRQPVPASAPSSAPRTKAAATKLTESQLRAFNRLGYKAGQEQEFLAMLNSDEVRF